MGLSLIRAAKERQAVNSTQMEITFRINGNIMVKMATLIVLEIDTSIVMANRINGGYYEDNKLIKNEFDSNHDGKVDRREYYK